MSPVNVLLVDDLEENLQALEGLLRRSDLVILSARSGAEALELLLRHEFALALIDVQMPTMNGFELAELMRGTERTRGIPIIFVTAGGADSHRLFRGYEAGAVDFLLKPLDPHMLKSKVSVFIELYRQKREVDRLLEKSERAAEALRSSEHQFRTMADSMPQLVWVARADGEHGFFNRRWYEYTGLNYEQSRGFGWQDAIHEDDREAVAARLLHSVQTGEAYEAEYRFRKHDGTYRWFLGRAYASSDASGSIERWFGTCTDIEDQKASEQKLSEALRAREDFLAVAGHELKTPLASLLLHVQGLERAAQGEAWPPRARERLHKASRAGLRLEKLVDELLDVSRIAAGRLELEPELLNIGALVSDVIARFGDHAERAHAPIRFEAPQDVMGMWDRARLDQVVTNLIANALKYGQGKPVEILVSADDDCVTLAVSDRGIGIELAEQGRIFERFERALGAREYGGFGLGLWIAREIVCASGGSIEVASYPGEGARFTVRLPRIMQSPGRTHALC